MQWFWVAIGGALGSALRMFLMGRFQAALPGVFPIGTLGVNLIGSLLIGFLGGWLPAPPASLNLRIFLITGILGGFTTFSAFSLDNLAMFRMGHARIAMLYILATNVLGIGLAFGGYFLARALSRSVAGS